MAKTRQGGHDGYKGHHGSTRRRRPDGKVPGPEPRHPTKHALNPPIVTIFGGGVAGLTAAHELVERGFYVQVIEQKEDPYRPGCPIVGGMAANQPARVRANLEDLHEVLIPIAADRGNPQNEVARWLLRLFAFNRARWIQSERPETLQLFIGDKTPEETILEPLRRARKRYKDRWLWDLVVRACKIEAITYDDDGRRGRPIEMDRAEAYYKKLVEENDVVKLAAIIRNHQSGAHMPNATDLLAKDNEEMVRLAFQREFLCFRLRPSVDSPDARRLLDRWVTRFKELELKGCCVTPASDEQPAGIPIPVPVADAESERIASGPVVVPPVDYEGPWLAIDVIEQRLPGEHGYRFFPTFYHHIEDTMRRIPLTPDDPVSGRSVLDNLKPTIRQGLGFSKEDIDKMTDLRGERPLFDEEPDRCGAPLPNRGSVVELHRTRPTSIEGFRNRTDRFVRRLGGTQRDAVFIFIRLLRFMMSSSERRKAEYQNMSWAQFLGITALDAKNNQVRVANSKLSKGMIEQIMSAAQALLAFSATEADARSYGNIAVQMLLDQLGDGSRVDRTLNGPTSDAWLEPWRRYLQRQGVRFFQGRLNGFELTEDGEVVPDFVVSDDKRSYEDGQLPLDHDKGPPGHQPDFYVLALNIEQSHGLVKSFVKEVGADAALERAPDFAALLKFGDKLAENKVLKDMTGLQFFFDAKTSIGRGHMYFPYSEWGLSSISQSEFWNLRSSFAEGFADVLSVDICTTGSFDAPEDGTFWRIMKGSQQPEPDEVDWRRLDVARSVWDQLKSRIDDRDRLAEPRYVHVDHNIGPWGNDTKFLGSLSSEGAPRPGYSQVEGCVGPREIAYSLNYDRWVMCGTFMATLTRLTTMEAANESARHAVNAILHALELDGNEAAKETAKPGALGFLDAASEDTRKESALWIETYVNSKYNGASKYRVFDPPDIFSLEDRELEDLDFFRRVDRRLQAMGLPHLFDIINFDRKVEHALDALDIYKDEKSFAEVLGLAMSNLDSLLVKELGIGYEERFIEKRRDDVRDAARGLTDRVPEQVFGDMKGLLSRFRNLTEALTKVGAV